MAGGETARHIPPTLTMARGWSGSTSPSTWCRGALDRNGTLAMFSVRFPIGSGMDLSGCHLIVVWGASGLGLTGPESRRRVSALVPVAVALVRDAHLPRVERAVLAVNAAGAHLVALMVLEVGQRQIVIVSGQD